MHQFPVVHKFYLTKKAQNALKLAVEEHIAQKEIVSWLYLPTAQNISFYTNFI